MSKLNKFDYEFLTDTWEGAKGAAFNQTAEFCREFGWIDYQGELTQKGYDAIREYRSERKDCS